MIRRAVRVQAVPRCRSIERRLRLCDLPPVHEHADGFPMQFHHHKARLPDRPRQRRRRQSCVNLSLRPANIHRIAAETHAEIVRAVRAAQRQPAQIGAVPAREPAAERTVRVAQIHRCDALARRAARRFGPCARRVHPKPARRSLPPMRRAVAGNACGDCRTRRALELVAGKRRSQPHAAPRLELALQRRGGVGRAEPVIRVTQPQTQLSRANPVARQIALVRQRQIQDRPRDVVMRPREPPIAIPIRHNQPLDTAHRIIPLYAPLAAALCYLDNSRRLP